MPTPFTIAVPEAELADLRARLRATRFPQTIENAGWDYGTEDAFLRRFVQYWAEDFDWSAAQDRLNTFAQFTETVDGQSIHSCMCGAGESAMCPSSSPMAGRPTSWNCCPSCRC